MLQRVETSFFFFNDFFHVSVAVRGYIMTAGAAQVLLFYSSIDNISARHNSQL